MLTVVARIEALPGREKDVEALLQGLVAPTHRETGCLQYDLHVSQDNPREFLFYENWTDTLALQAHLQTAHIAAAMDKARSLLAKPVEIRCYAKISGETERPH